MADKQVYATLIEAELEALIARIDALASKAEETQSGLEEEFAGRLGSARAKQEMAEAQVSALKQAPDDVWESLQRAVEDALGELDQAVTGAVSSYPAD